MQWSALDGLVLRRQNANQLVSIVAHELFVGPLPKVHDEVGRAEAQRLGDAKQVRVLVDEAHLLFALAGLDNASLRQDDILRLREENHVLLVQQGAEQDRF